ncbi:MAG: phosphoglycerate dehydrogenase [Cytophagales bacterium]|nr:phosphoglycerate dehydrogenase [Cytophagales bacterium]
MHECIVPLLEAQDFKVEYAPELSRKEILEVVGDYHGLIVRSKTPIDSEMIAQAGRLEFVARAGAGIDNLDTEELSKRKIEVINAPEGNRDAVGEHTLAMILCLFNNIHTADREVRQGIWKREANRGIELKGKTVGIVGYGNMGQAVAQRFSGFGCKVLAYDKYRVNYGDLFAEEVSMDRIFQEADILSLHTPLTNETRMMIDEEYFGRFHKPVFFVNMARGEIVSLRSLNEAMDSGKLRGAVLDVLENEKLASMSEDQAREFERLTGRSNVLFTPHVGGWTKESYREISEVLAKKIQSFYSVAGY